MVKQVGAQLAGSLRPGARVVAALSGGIDSVALLDVLQQLSARLDFHLSALHVNHQLSPHAGRWASFCRCLCRSRGIPIRTVRVTIPREENIESAARAARYAAFSREPGDHVVLAHHQDDQVETVFLQLLRGAGVRGMAAMPFQRDEGRGVRDKRKARDEGRGTRTRTAAQSLDTRPSILRPFLDVTRAEIEAYARARHLEWVDDESNASLHFQRNFLRHQVLPEIAKRFPAYRTTVARAARHLAESLMLLDEVARADATGAISNGALAVAVLRELSPARSRNLLRYFLAGRGVAMPSTVRLEEALRQALGAKQDARTAIELGEFELRKFDGRLYVVSARAAPRADYWKLWRGERELRLPELGGVLVMAPSRGAGLSLARLRERPVAIRARSGGERLQPDCRRPRRTLKNLLQEAHIPPWERERLPLVFCGNDLAWVPAIGIDCAYQAGPGERSISPSWRPGGSS